MDYRWKSDALASMAADIRKGTPPSEAAESAKKEAKLWIEKHNARRPKDINWKRWDGAVDSVIDNALRYFSQKPTPSVPAENTTASEAVALQPFAADQFREYLPVMLKQVNKEVTPRKKLMAAMSVMHGLNPDAIKALAEELKMIEPEA